LVSSNNDEFDLKFRLSVETKSRYQKLWGFNLVIERELVILAILRLKLNEAKLLSIKHITGPWVGSLFVLNQGQFN